MEKIGVIGLGAIGSLIVKRLLANGAEIIVYDLDQNNMASLVQLGVKTAVSPADVAANRTFIFNCDTDAQTAEDVLLGTDGVIDNIQPGSVVVEASTSTPTRTRRIAELLEKRSADIIDASVITGATAAENDTLSFMVGGKEEVFERCHPILSILGTDIVHVGDLGSGHVVKAVTMMMLGANLVAAAEIVGLGVKAGLDRKKILEVINVSSGESFVTSNHYIKHILPKTYDLHFTLPLMLKDIRIGTQMAHEMDIPALVATRIEEIYAMACYQGMALEDCTKIVSFIERLMGLQS